MKKWIIRILLGIVALIVIAVITVEINKEKIASAAADEINNQIRGTFSYEKVNVSLLSSFPYLGVRFEGINLKDEVQREKKALYREGELNLQLNLLSLFRDRENVKVYRFGLKGGEIYAASYKDGSTNYQLFEESTEKPTATSPNLKIEEFYIDQVHIIYSDEASSLIAKLTPLSLDGTISISGNEVVIDNSFTSPVEIDFSTFLPNYRFNLEGDLQMIAAASYDHFEIKKTDLKINHLPIRLTGVIEQIRDTYDYDLSISAPNSSITQAISLIPKAYKKDIGELSGEGSFSMNADIKGNTADNYPTYKLEIKADGKNISNAQLPKKLDVLAFDVKVSNTTKNSAYSQVDLRDLNLIIDKSFVKGDLNIMPTANGQKVETDISLDFDLSDWQESLSTLSEETLEGKLKGFIKSSFETNRDNNILLKGEQPISIDLVIDAIKIDQKDANPITINHIDIKNEGQDLKFNINRLDYLGAVKMNTDGQLDQFIESIIDPTKKMVGNLNIEAEKLDMESLPSSEIQRMYNIPNVEINTHFASATIRQNGYLLTNTTADGVINNENSSVKFEVQDLMGNSFKGEGSLKNVLGYGLNRDTLSGQLNVISQKFSLDPFMLSNENSKVDGSSLVPGNLAIKIDYQADQLKFKNFDFSKAIGEVNIERQTVILHNGGNIFGGNVQMSLSFDASTTDSFLIDLNINLNDLGFSQTAQNTKLFNQLIPIAPFMQGKYNSTLSWKSKLNKDFIPDLNSLTAYGDIKTTGASISSLVPFQEVLSRFTTTTQDKGSILLDDINRYFAVQEGRVILEKAEFKKENIDFLISGSHSFSQDMDYKLIMDIPKDKLKLDQLLAEAKGILNIKQDWLKLAPNAMVELELAINGNIKKPIFKLVDVRIKTGNIVKSVAEEVEKIFNEEKDKISNTVKDSVNKTKEQIENRIENAKDSLTRLADSTMAVVKGVIDSTKVKAEEELNKEKEQIKKESQTVIDSIKAGNLDSLGNKIDDIFKNRTGKLEEIKDKIKVKWPKKNGDD